MGFSTSAAVVIFAASLMYIAIIFYPLANLSSHRVLEAKENYFEMQDDKLNTRIVIANTRVVGSDINVMIYNNGSVSLNSSRLNVIHNGVFTSSFAVDNNGVWVPRKPINVTIYGVISGRIKIITANGASDYAVT